jgi:acetyl esterase
VIFGPHALRLRTIRPHTAIDRSPVIMYFHGAGWVMGDSTTHDRLVRKLAVGTNATIVFVDYDRAPEHRYPVAIEQAYAATCYVSERAEEFGVGETHLRRPTCQTVSISCILMSRYLERGAG